jgi:hypothetical protein
MATSVDSMIKELFDMIAADPNRGTANESVFLDHTRERTRAIGTELNKLGGMQLMLSAHAQIRSKHRTSSRHLESAWHGIGAWRD